MGLKGEDAQIWVTDYADTTSMTQEACDPVGAGTPVLLWQVTDHSKDVFDPDVTFSVEVSTDNGSSWSTASTSNYEILWTVGAIKFDSDPFGGSTSGNDVRIASGSYLPKHVVVDGFETEITVEPNLLDVTGFQDDSPQRITGLQGLTGSFGTHEVLATNIDADGDDDGPTLDDIVLHSGSTSGDFVFRFDPANNNTTMLGAWVRFDSDSREASSGDVQSQSFSMSVDTHDSAMASQPAADIDLLTL